MLENLHIKQTELTPFISLDYKKSIMQIKGVLVPEDAFDFFSPIFNWVDQYHLNSIKGLRLEIELDHFNTTSARMLLELMRRVKKKPNQQVIWNLDSEDEDMIEVVNDYNELLGGVIAMSLKTENYSV